MGIAKQLRPPRCAGVILSGALGLAGCETSGLCPTCPPLTGGESHDFGGTPSACALVEETSLIDAARASELGFDVPLVTERVQREVDAPLYWTTGSGALRASGFDRQTRVQATVTVTSYSYVAIDPEACDGFDCPVIRVGNEVVAEDLVCPDRLRLGIEVALRTLDGAIETTAVGYALWSRPGFSFGQDGEALAGSPPAGSAFASPRDVRGSFRVSPESSLHDAVLITSLYFKPDSTEGEISLSDGTGEGTLGMYAMWPNPPFRSGPGVAIPDED
jgi:hypothetical protein